MLSPKLNKTKGGSSSQKKDKPSEIPVPIFIVNSQPLYIELRASGTIIPNEEVELKAEASGKVTGVFSRRIRSSKRKAFSKNNWELQKSNLYPKLSFNIGGDGGLNYLGREGTPSKPGNSYDYYANFTLNYTLFNGGKTRNSIENAGITVAIDHLGINQQKLSMKNQLVSLLDLYQLRKGVLQIVDDNIAAANAELNLAETKYKNGSISIFEFRQVQLTI